MSEINWELLKKVKNVDALPVNEFIKYLKFEYLKAIQAILNTESDELIRKKVVRAQTLKELLTLLGQSLD
jgi:hypothetical protein